MRGIERTLRPELINLNTNLPEDFYKKLFNLYFNHQEKPFFTNEQADSKEFVGVIFEEDKKQQYLCITYFNQRRGYAEILMQLSDDNKLSVSEEYNSTTLVKKFQNLLVASYQDNTAYKMVDDNLEPMQQIHSFNNVLDKTKTFKKK